LEVDRGTVVYVALEGSHGARNRIEALKRGGLLPENAPLFLCFAPVSLLTARHAERLAETVRRAAAQTATRCRLVILDTLARAMAGGDENKGQDMTAAVAAIDSIREWRKSFNTTPDAILQWKDTKLFSSLVTW
jgi:hypothetical protein